MTHIKLHCATSVMAYSRFKGHFISDSTYTEVLLVEMQIQAERMFPNRSTWFSGVHCDRTVNINRKLKNRVDFFLYMHTDLNRVQLNYGLYTYNLTTMSMSVQYGSDHNSRQAFNRHNTRGMTYLRNMEKENVRHRVTTWILTLEHQQY